MKISIKQTIMEPQTVLVRSNAMQRQCERELGKINAIIENINRDLRKALR